MKDVNEKQVPTKDNDIFDHSADSMAASTGVTKEDVGQYFSKNDDLMEAILDSASGLKSGSVAVEMMVKMPPKVVAGMLLASLKKEIDRNPVHKIMLELRAAAKQAEQRRKAQQN